MTMAWGTWFVQDLGGGVKYLVCLDTRYAPEHGIARQPRIPISDIHWSGWPGIIRSKAWATKEIVCDFERALAELRIAHPVPPVPRFERGSP